MEVSTFTTLLAISQEAHRAGSYRITRVHPQETLEKRREEMKESTIISDFLIIVK